MRVLRIFHTDSEEATIEAGAEIATLLPPAAIVLLVGNLGAGKTTLAKGVARAITGMDPDDVTSPTYTLIHEYSPELLHLDLYRLETEKEVLGLGFEDLLDRPALILIEWGERFPALIPPEHFEVRFTAKEDTREIHLLGPDRKD